MYTDIRSSSYTEYTPHGAIVTKFCTAIDVSNPCEVFSTLQLYKIQYSQDTIRLLVDGEAVGLL